MGSLPTARHMMRGIRSRGCRGMSSGPGPWRRIALVFPGQGAQHPGMGKALLDQFPYTRFVFEEVEEASQLSLRRIMFEGDESTLRNTAITQPALLCHSVAALRVLENECGLSVGQGGPAVAAMGHSLGEFSALVATGALSLFDGARLVRERGLAMAEAHEAAGAPGAMAALLRPNEAAVHRLCREVAEETGLVLGVANYNGPGQVVISGHAAAVARAVESARPQRAAARAVDLPVGAAFHSPYMWSAAERIAALVGTDAGVLRAELGALSVGDASPEELDAVLARCVDRDGAEAEAAEVAVGDATVPIVSNTTATAATAAAALRWRATLHSPAPVQWGRSLQEARRLDATAFLEVGTGAVQTGIVGQVLGKGVETRAFGEDPADVADLLAVLAQE